MYKGTIAIDQQAAYIADYASALSSVELSFMGPHLREILSTMGYVIYHVPYGFELFCTTIAAFIIRSIARVYIKLKGAQEQQVRDQHLKEFISEVRRELAKLDSES